MVERDLAKVEVAGSNPVFRSNIKDVTSVTSFLYLPISFSSENEVAGMVELVDTQDLKSCERKLVRVRFPLLVQI